MVRRTTWYSSLGLLLTAGALALTGCVEETPGEIEGEPVGPAPAELAKADRPERPQGERRQMGPRKRDGKAEMAERPQRRGDRQGQKGKAAGKKLFAKMDVNSDGQLTKEEVRQSSSKIFAELDADSDGSLTQDELAARRGGQGKRGEQGKRSKQGRRGGKLLKRADQDGDGVLSQGEFESAQLKLFERVDQDDDGVVALDELKQRRRGRQGGEKPQRGERRM